VANKYYTNPTDTSSVNTTQLNTWLEGNKTALSTAQSALVNAQLALTQARTALDGNMTIDNGIILTFQGSNPTLASNITSFSNYAILNIISLEAQIQSLSSYITSLNTQLDNLERPNFVSVSLMSSDNRPWLQTPYLLVQGYLFNTGVNASTGTVLHVQAFQGSVLAFNTTVSLGTVYGRGSVYVNSQITYTGSALTSWRVWTTGFDETRYSS
jgi:hypothetical protein